MNPLLGLTVNLRSHRIEDQVLLGLRSDVVDLETTQCGQNRLTVGNAILGDQIARRLGQVVHSNNNDETEEDLEGNGESPDQIRWAIVGTKVDPIRNGRANGNDTTFDTYQQTTVARFGALGLVGRNGGCVHSVTNAGDDSTEEELEERDMVGECRHLDDDTDDHDGRAENDHPSTTEPVTKQQGKDSTDETPWGGSQTR